MLQELSECFIAQIERSAVIEKGLKEITDILILNNDNFKMQYKKKICQCCKELTNEQVKIITDRQTLIKSQNQFQKIFSDYNSILHELEITFDISTKLNVLKNNIVCENLQMQEQLKEIKWDQESLQEEEKLFYQEKDILETEKKYLKDQKKSLDMEWVSLHNERKLLDQEINIFSQEKMLLYQKSELYRNRKRELQNKKKVL